MEFSNFLCDFDMIHQVIASFLWDGGIAGPGLAIRVICTDEAFICKDFQETNILLKIVADYANLMKKVRIFHRVSFALLSAKLAVG